MGKCNKIRLLILAGVAAFALTGCNKNNDDLISEELNNIEDDVQGNSSASKNKLIDRLGIKEDKWEEQFVTSYNETITISAKVEVPDTDHMSILSMERRLYASAERKELVEKICEGREIYAFDDTNPPKWYYESRINYISGEISDVLAAKKQNRSLTGEGGQWEETDDAYYENLLSELSSYQEKQQSASEMGDAPGNYNALSYMGEGEKDRIVIYFFTGENENDIETISWDRWGINTVKEDFSITDNYSIIDDDIDYGNMCEMSEEEAVWEATEYIQSLGYSDFEMKEIDPLSWERIQISEEADHWTDGYSVTFTRSVDGILEDILGYGFYGANEAFNYYDTFGENITVYINDTGIFHCDIRNSYNIGEIVSSNTLLLSYDQVKGIMKDYLISEDDIGGSMFTNMELIYFLNKNNENTSLIPVWRLSKKETLYGTDYANPYVLINAIDGSTIDPADGIS